ncbi:MAG: adenosine deaminase family protein [Verrucomicrobia bacterium]|nr:adenosine deaminase family protein [Verrucomicrobiota bacterium]MCH8511893.1 adenosine deaminase family protein [Kiritimatiellia bacterium]
MQTQIPPGYLQALPKTDLHVHLDGSLRLPTLMDLAEAGKVELPADSEAGLKEKIFKPAYADLREYLAGFQYTVAVMQTPEALERVARELAEDNLAENVRYLEVRFAPQLHLNEQLHMREVLEAVTRGLRTAQTAHNRRPEVVNGEDVPFHFGIIVCALRWFGPFMSPYYAKLFEVMANAREKDIFAAASLELARAAVRLREEAGLPIVGFDLAGAEDGNPAVDHKAAFLHAHRSFLRKTVHAGEAYGPESIFQALTECHADRIGHGTFLFNPDKVRDPAIRDPERYVHQLVESVAHRRICIEVNLTSNLQTLPDMGGIGEHPLRLMVDHNLSATICTDNRLVSHTTVTRELELAVQHFDLTPPQLRNLVVAGFKGCFFPGDYREKRAFVRQILNRIDRLEAEHIGPSPHL